MTTGRAHNLKIQRPCRHGHQNAQCIDVVDGIGNVGNDIERYLNLLSIRQRLTASNIANADTPGYKTRDIDFQAEFAAALNGTSPRVLEVNGLAVKNDGNNVSLDREARMLAENALRFNIGIQLLKGELKDVRKAINGGGNDTG